MYEKILDKFIDRTYSPTLVALGGCTKLSLGELYYVIRNVGTIKKYPALKEKMLGRKGNIR